MRLGELSLDLGSAGIRFTCHGDADQSVVVPNEKIAALVAFLEEHSHAERRVGFRVPLRPLSAATRQAFEVTVEANSKKASAIPVDISLTGILLEIPDLKVRTGQRVSATLCLDNDCVLLDAKVVRRVGKLVVLHFPSCIKDDELDPPEGLLGIYRTLELDWLKSRTPT
jgi:hypothetical protein